MFKFKCKYLPKHSDIYNYPTRNDNKFIAPKCNMRKSEMSINFKSIKVWNKFHFLGYAVSLCNVLPSIGQYSIDISIKYSFTC